MHFLPRQWSVVAHCQASNTHRANLNPHQIPHLQLSGVGMILISLDIETRHFMGAADEPPHGASAAAGVALGGRWRSVGRADADESARLRTLGYVHEYVWFRCCSHSRGGPGWLSHGAT